MLERVDHLVYAARDLDLAIDDLERRLGVRAVMGGSHPGRGTRNALLALGPASYLEILAPDSSQPSPSSPRWLGVDDVTEARLTTWAAKATDLENAIERAAKLGVQLGSVREGARTRVDGVHLKWRLTDSSQLLAGGLVPFLIDWGDSPHPAAAAPRGLRLIDLHGESPDPERAIQMLRALDIEMSVRHASDVALIATIESPRGVAELR